MQYSQKKRKILYFAIFSELRRILYFAIFSELRRILYFAIISERPLCAAVNIYTASDTSD